MNGFSKVFIMGTLGADPQIYATKDGKEFTSLSLATTRYWRNKEGNSERKTDWHRVMVWGKKALICQANLKKGSPVCVEGFLTTYAEENDGQKKWITSVTAEEVSFMGRAPESEPAIAAAPLAESMSTH